MIKTRRASSCYLIPMKRTLGISSVGPLDQVSGGGCWSRKIASFSLVLSLLISVGSCDTNPPTAPDARSADLMVELPDGLGIGEAGVLTSVDFLVQGCAERTATNCKGPIPLKLVFFAVLQDEGHSVTWNFGDGSPVATDPVIEHTFSNIGAFSVTLSIGSTSGTISEQKADFVVTEAASAGAPCEKDSSCLSGTCLCQSSCDYPLKSGLCLEDCTELACQSSATVCINLSRPDLEEVMPDLEPWRTHLCLPSCKIDGDCQREGFFCKLAPGKSGWHNACLPPLLRDIGEPCRDLEGTPDPLICLGGRCLDLGASGYCSVGCSEGACPVGTRCARFPDRDGDTACLLQCEEGGCTGDPMLACEAPDAAGQYGFEILGPGAPPGITYCSVKRCGEDSECGLFGRCDLDLGGFCIPDQN